MNPTKYDAIVIGAGQNGLTTGAFLAKAGKSVLILEQLEYVGGLCGSYEFHPGYKTSGLFHDTSGLNEKVVKELELEKYGLQIEKNKSFVILGPAREAIEITENVEDTAKSISNYSERDARAYLEYASFLTKISGFLQELSSSKPPKTFDLKTGDYLSLLKKGFGLRKLGRETMMEFLKVGPMSVADFLNEKFETDFLKSGLALDSVQGSYVGPWSSYTTLTHLYNRTRPNKRVIGGSSQLIKALESCCSDLGVEIRCSSKVAKVRVDSNEVVAGVTLSSGEEISSRIVAASNSPKQLFGNLIDHRQMGHTLQKSISNLRSRGTCALLNIALDREVSWKNQVGNIEFAKTGSSLDGLEQAFDSIKYDEFSKSPELEIHVPTKDNKSLSPDKTDILSVIISFAPKEIEGGWNDNYREILTASVIAKLGNYVENLKESIVASELLTPADIESRYEIPGGSIYHLEHALDQVVMRPLPEMARYNTLFSGLFLCGSGSHPGGGVSCSPGYLASKEMVKY